MSYAGWHVGMKIVCIDGRRRGGFGDEIIPAKGAVYTVRQIGIDPTFDQASLLLVEIVNPQRKYIHRDTGEHLFTEPAFLASYFRPVQKRSSDISVFKAMLHGSPAPAEPPNALHTHSQIVPALPPRADDRRDSFVPSAVSPPLYPGPHS